MDRLVNVRRCLKGKISSGHCPYRRNEKSSSRYISRSSRFSRETKFERQTKRTRATLENSTGKFEAIGVRYRLKKFTEIWFDEISLGYCLAGSDRFIRRIKTIYQLWQRRVSENGRKWQINGKSLVDAWYPYNQKKIRRLLDSLRGEYLLLKIYAAEMPASPKKGV